MNLVVDLEDFDSCYMEDISKGSIYSTIKKEEKLKGLLLQ